MTLDENELCMIEQLCYLSVTVGKVARIKNFEGIRRRNEKLKNLVLTDTMKKTKRSRERNERN